MNDKQDQVVVYSLTSSAYGAKHGIKGESVRMRYYKTGSYFGDVPRRSPNGRLLWPDYELASKKHGND